MSGSIYDELRQRIVSHEYPPGFPLVEMVLADDFAVSRTPIREALFQLLHDGLIERKGRGFFVTAPSPEEVLEIYEVRIPLEALAAEWAAKRRTELDLNRIMRAQDDLRNTPITEPRRRAQANHLFHRQLWVASHNSRLVDTLERLCRLVRHPTTTLEYPGRFEISMCEHDELIAAIVAGDAAKAYEIGQRHISAARSARLMMYSPAEISEPSAV